MLLQVPYYRRRDGFEGLHKNIKNLILQTTYKIKNDLHANA